MKFANKLFLIMTALLTVIFTVFGIWMLSSYFTKAIAREKDRANAESSMFQLMFESAYAPMESYGVDYATRSVMENIAFGIERNGSLCLVWDDRSDYYCNAGINSGLNNAIKKVGNRLHPQVINSEAKMDIYSQQYEYTYVAEIELQEEAMMYLPNESPIYVEEQKGDVTVYREMGNYAVAIEKIEEEYYIITVCKSDVSEDGIYLGMSRNITAVYQERQDLVVRYCISLGILLLVGSTIIFLLSRYITKPIRNLNTVVNQITGGNFEKRCEVKSNDEIGTLAENFNQMTDAIVDHMHQKELEAKQKESFTTAFAHELKTPLTSIIGYADMLNTVDMTEEERSEAYYYIYSQGKRLESLSHKLLELAEVDKNPIKTKAISTKELEENIKTTMRPVFEKKKIKYKITMEKGWLHADKDLILSAFYNLLDNAVKAVEEGGTVKLSGVRLANDSYEIKVSDNGRGIPEEEISRITEAFYMVDKSRSRKEGGAGIGMALCQKIISLHNAEMHIHSKIGEGCVVQLLFPKPQEEV